MFKRYIYKTSSPEFNKVNRSQYGNGCSFDRKIIEYQSKNCFIPTKGYCFINCIKYLTGHDYKQQYIDFIRNEKRRSNIMTMARIQSCLRKLGIDLGYYNGDRVFPRTVTNRDCALYFYNNHFCLIWKSEGVSYNQAVEELKDIFKKVDNYITEENVNSHFKYVFIPKKIESHLAIFIVYDLETQNTDRASPYVLCFYRLCKQAGRYNRDLTPDELEKCRKDTIAFDGNKCVEKALDFCLNMKGDERKVKNKIVDYNLQ